MEVAMLESLGLSAQAEQVYRLMLAFPDLGVAGLADRLALTETDVRAALDDLADLALLRPSSARPGLLRPVSPDVGLASLLARAEAEVLQQQRQIEATRAAIKTISAEQLAAAQAVDGVRRYEDVDSVRIRLEELAANATRECVSLNPGSAQVPEAKETSKPLNQLALERGVAIRCVYQDSYRNDPGVVGYARWLSGLGGQVRTVPTLPMLLVVVDQRIALLPLDPEDSSRGAVEVVHSGVVAAIYALFDQVWRTAIPLGVASAPDIHGVDPVARAVLEILAAGHTDEVAARKLNLSLRTVRRITAGIMEVLDARSRFQAGVLAAQRGWL
ncbi:helix-turn-helix transcriptional regulator [Micromonospora sp. MS34]|uniref:helix-turn-helix transcriptional regulator n=1 Tax=Micromonospora sp. MS34 TaxID=3385971 RepID=UPI0039A24D84